MNINFDNKNSWVLYNSKSLKMNLIPYKKPLSFSSFFKVSPFAIAGRHLIVISTQLVDVSESTYRNFWLYMVKNWMFNVHSWIFIAFSPRFHNLKNFSRSFWPSINVIKVSHHVVCARVQMPRNITCELRLKISRDTWKWTISFDVPHFGSKSNKLAIHDSIGWHCRLLSNHCC